MGGLCMKQSLFKIIFFILFLFSTASVSLAFSTNLENDMLIIGSPTTNAGSYHHNSFTVNTTQNLTLNVSNDLYTNLNITMVQDNITGTTQSTITITAYIPEGLNAVNSSGNLIALKVADLFFYEENNQSNNASIELHMQRKNNLVFDIITLDSADFSRRITDGRRIDFLSPGSSGIFEIKLKNTFSSSSYMAIRDITIDIFDIQGELDFNEDESISSISSGDDEIETFSINIDDDVDEGLYDVVIRIKGTDDNGAKHGSVIIVTFDIRRERDDVSIIRTDMLPNTINNCNEQLIRLTVTIKNTGRNNQRNTAISVENNELIYSALEGQISLDKGDSKIRVFNIVIPKGTSAGIYNLVVSALNDKNEIKNQKLVPIVISACPLLDSSSSSYSESPPSKDNVQVVGSATFSNVVSAQPVTQPITQTSIPDKKDSFEIPLKYLFAGFIILLILVIGLGIIVFTK
jgi:hypothetical protein